MRLAGTNGLRLHGDIVGGEGGDGQWARVVWGGGAGGAPSLSLPQRGPLRNLGPRAPARSRSPRLAPPSPQPSPSGRGGGGEEAGTHKGCPYAEETLLPSRVLQGSPTVGSDALYTARGGRHAV